MCEGRGKKGEKEDKGTEKERGRENAEVLREKEGNTGAKRRKEKRRRPHAGANINGCTRVGGALVNEAQKLS